MCILQVHSPEVFVEVLEAALARWHEVQQPVHHTTLAQQGDQVIQVLLRQVGLCVGCDRENIVFVRQRDGIGFFGGGAKGGGR